MNDLICRINAFALGFIVFVALNSNGIFSCAMVKALDLSDFPEIGLTQIANMKIVFLGVPSDYIDESNFVSRIIRSTSQFANPNNMTWNLNVSIVFHEFPVEVINSLINNTYHFEGTTYYNITLLDELLSQFEYLAAPKQDI
ncbi:MAG: hypothetical protein QMD13_08310 [Candidatus Bathyarchaeia archaeon]|nr:hypothetical protein [Candidatus Bathyarchaeia archaeon]